MKRGHLVAACCLLLALGCASGPVSASCVTQDLGPFSMCVPIDWKLTRGGIDSAAGTFRAGNLSVNYDFGLYSDPLPIPPGATEASDTGVAIDGLPGRSVVYSMPPQYFAGFHLPGVRSTSMGTIKLTMVAQGSSKASLEEAEAAFRTIRIDR